MTDFAVGDRVAVWPLYYDGTCAACKRALFNICENFSFHGVNSHGGGMSEFTTIEASKLHKLPETLDLIHGALVEPMAVAWHAVRLSRIEPGQSALVSGAGPIGVWLIFALRANGIDEIIVSELSPSRRDLVAKLAETHLVDPGSEELGSVVANVTDGAGVDVAFDAAGAGAALLQGIDTLGPRGRSIVVALYEKGVDLNPTQLVLGEKGMVGSLAYLHEDYDDVIAAMSDGKYNLAGWVEEIDLDDVEEAFHDSRAGNRMKVLVKS